MSNPTLHFDEYDAEYESILYESYAEFREICWRMSHPTAWSLRLPNHFLCFFPIFRDHSKNKVQRRSKLNFCQNSSTTAKAWSMLGTVQTDLTLEPQHFLEL